MKLQKQTPHQKIPPMEGAFPFLHTPKQRLSQRVPKEPATIIANACAHRHTSETDAGIEASNDLLHAGAIKLLLDLLRRIDQHVRAMHE